LLTKYFKPLQALLFLCCCLVLTGCSSSNTKPTTIKIGVLRVPNDVAVAQERKMLQAKCRHYGMKVQFITFDSGVDANKALLSNSVQLATMGHTNAVVAMAARIPVKLVWINDIIGSNEALTVRRKAHITNWDSFKGKSIATPFASTSHYSLMMLLKHHHLTGKVRVLDMQTPEIVAAWQRGDIDGAYTWEPSLSALTDGKVMINSRSMAQRGYLTANVTLATNSFINAHPNILRTILSCLNKVHLQFENDPQELYLDAAKSLSMPTSVIKKQIGTSQWLNTHQQEAFISHTFRTQFFNTAQFMWQQQTLSRPISRKDWAQFVTVRFLNSGGQ
jgi:taurine transport system substrate-binding protein